MNREEAQKRAKELVGKMTLLERAAQLKYDAAPVERLGVPAYNWWNEALHGVARAGTATVFPQAIGLAAMFDGEMMMKIGDTIATEGRAKYNEYSRQNDRDIYKGLTFWSPNVNIFRDPRWGRGHETYGEDPYLTSRLGVAFVEGLQGEWEKNSRNRDSLGYDSLDTDSPDTVLPDHGYLKAAACAKHYAVHSGPENLRHEFDAVVSKKDMEETYLPAFKALVTKAHVESVMGAYNRTNGEPCCGSKTLLSDTLRDKWGFEGHVVSDCWAVRDFHEHHHVTGNAQESAAMALKAGCDINCGNTYLHMMAAYENGLVTEEDITRAAERAMTTRFMLGLFDETEYDKIPYEKVECREHVKLALEAAEKASVLLKNDGVLPLQKDYLKTIGVIGPNANSRIALYGNYYGTSSRDITVLEGIQDEVGDNIRVLYSKGCDLVEDRTEHLAWRQDRISEAITVVQHSDVAILCLGLDESLEGEEHDTGNSYGSGDKADLHLPKIQEELMEAVSTAADAAGKPVILILLAGSAIDLNYADEHFNAILLGWYPGARGGKSIADLLFGNTSPSGKLPITFYRNLDNMPEFTDYSMKNRTYRYMEGEALYPFGYGLTYTTTEITAAKLCSSPAPGDDFTVEATISNSGTVETEEVIQVYIKDTESPNAVNNHSLCAFRRVHLKAGEMKTIHLDVKGASMTAINEQGEHHVESQHFLLYVGISQPDSRSIFLTGSSPLIVELTLDS